MALHKFNPTTQNNEIGLTIGKSRRVIINKPFGERANWIQAGTGGLLVYKNLEADETSVILMETGQLLAIACDVILTSAFIDHGEGPVEETTTASDLFWAATPANLGKQ